MEIDRDKYTIEWMEFIYTSMEHHWKLKGTLLKIENSVKLVYGEDYCKTLMKKINFGLETHREHIDDLEKIYKNFINNIKLRINK